MYIIFYKDTFFEIDVFFFCFRHSKVNKIFLKDNLFFNSFNLFEF